MALIAGLVALAAWLYPPAMNVRGERILIFGDSLTQHAAGSNPIWNVDQGPQRSHPGPGDMLASYLLDQGAAAVRTNALGARSAYNFWTREGAQAASLIAADLAWRPTKIVFVLGTNDIGLTAGPDEAAFVRLRDAYKPSKAELWAIGPFVSRMPAAGIETVARTMSKVFGSRFIDGRKLSQIISPGPDGVHYTTQGARLLALNMADALTSTSPIKAWLGVAIGAGVVIGAGLVYGLVTERRGALAGFESRWRTRIPVSEQDRATLAILRKARSLLTHGRSRVDIVGAAAEELGLDPVNDKHATEFVRYVAKQAWGDKAGSRVPPSDEEAKAALARAISRLEGKELAGLEIVNGKRWNGSTSELVRSGFRQVPCKSGLDKAGQARCWTRGLRGADTEDQHRGLGVPHEHREALASVIADYKDVARKMRYHEKDHAFGMCDTAARHFIGQARAAGVPLEPFRFDLTNRQDLLKLKKLYKLSPKEFAEVKQQIDEMQSRDPDEAAECMYHEVAVSSDGTAIDWTANQFKALPVPFIFHLEPSA